MRTEILMTFVTEFAESDLDKAVDFYNDVAIEKRYLDRNLKLTRKRFVHNEQDNHKFGVVAYYSTESEDAEPIPECAIRKLPAPDTNS